MQNLQIIKNYAAALLANISSEKDKDKVLTELKIIAEIINNDKLCSHALNSPVKDKQTKISLMKSIITEKKFSKNTETFLSLLTHNNRIDLLSAIVESSQTILNEQRKVKYVEIISAGKLKDKDKQYVTRKLEQELNYHITPKFVEDGSLIGGLRIKYDSKLIDLSIASALTKINKQIKNIALEE